MRGTRKRARKQRGVEQFIPAYAGNAQQHGDGRCQAAVHPRVCGERNRQGRLRLTATGSSPRMRGTPCLRCQRLESRTVHPRVCGERRGNTYKNAYRDGSSPRMRGTLPTRPLSLSLNAVHPRVCGERLRNRTRKKSKDGSSPRMRGTLPRARNRTRGSRFIPAYAGNALHGGFDGG